MAQQAPRIQEEPSPHRVTVREWQQMGEAGIFDPEARLELLDGEIITMSPIGTRHATVAYLLNDFFGERNHRRYLVGLGNPLEADSLSEPVPDFMLVPRHQAVAGRHPLAAEPYLVIEIADSSLPYDRGRKMRKYAEAGVREYWIVNLRDDVVEIFRNPRGAAYAQQLTARGADVVAPEAFPDCAAPVTEFIPAR